MDPYIKMKNLLEKLVDDPNLPQSKRKNLKKYIKNYSGRENLEEAIKTTSFNLASISLSQSMLEISLLDNEVNQEERKILNILQDESLMKVKKEKTNLPLTGKMWRIHYYKIEERKVEEYLEVEEEKEDEEESIYSKLGDEMWGAHEHKKKYKGKI